MGYGGKGEEYERGLRTGYSLGFADGQKRKAARAARQPVIKSEDGFISEFVDGKSIVYCEDLIGFLGIDDNRGNRIVVGNAIRRLGWIRKREAPPSRRWYYERGVIAPNAI